MKLAQLRERRNAKAKAAHELNAKYPADKRMSAEDAAALDALLADPALYTKDPGRAQNTAQQRGQLSKQLGEAEEAWLLATEAYEDAAVGADA